MIQLPGEEGPEHLDGDLLLFVRLLIVVLAAALDGVHGRAD